MLKRLIIVCLFLCSSNIVLADCGDMLKTAAFQYNTATGDFNQAVTWYEELPELDTLEEQCRLLQRAKSIVMGAKKGYLACDSGFFQVIQHCSDKEGYNSEFVHTNMNECMDSMKDSVSFHVELQQMYKDNCIGTQ